MAEESKPAGTVPNVPRVVRMSQSLR